MKATIVDLRYKTKQVLKAVDRGETVTLLYRGREKARIVPVPAKRQPARLRSHAAFGLWKDREDMRNVRGYLRKLRRGRTGDL